MLSNLCKRLPKMTLTKPLGDRIHYYAALHMRKLKVRRKEYLLKATQLATWSQESHSDPCNSKVSLIATWLTDAIIIQIPSTPLSSTA